MATPGTQVYWDPSRGYVDEKGQSIAAPTNRPTSNVWAPNLGATYDYGQQALDDYFRSLKLPTGPEDYTQRLESVGPYQGFDWTNPEEYYSGPAPYSAGQFSDVPDLMASAKGQYEGQRAAQREGIAGQFKDVRSQIEEELARGNRRPEQAAALLANLGNQQVQQTQSAMRDIDFQQMQNEQQLQQTQYQLQQQQEAAQMGENQYAYQQSLDDARFRAGLQQYYQEQKAAEEQSKYQSQYGLAQDVSSLGLQQYDVGRAADYDYYNALLQGQQAASQQFSQAGTYTTNLSEGERANARSAQQKAGQDPYASYKVPSYPRSSPTITGGARPRYAQGGSTYA